MTHCGRICFKGRKINLSHVFAGRQVGVKQVDERIWLVSFMHYDLGYFADETCRLEPIAKPFGPRVLHNEYRIHLSIRRALDLGAGHPHHQLVPRKGVNVSDHAVKHNHNIK